MTNDPNLTAANEIAEQVCGCNGYPDALRLIRFSWCDRLYRSIANCRWVEESGLYEIHLSRRLFPKASFDECVETVVHETCHVLANFINKQDCGHGEVWKLCMERAGYQDPKDYYVAGS
jgi:predicted SprT family Zn-dependent metalloprotease